MNLCPRCKGEGECIDSHLTESGNALKLSHSPCLNCKGSGLLPDPDLVRIAEALERLAVLLHEHTSLEKA